MTAAALVFATASAGIWLPSKVVRIRAHRRSVLQARIDEEGALAEAMWQANVDGFGRLGREALR